MPDEEIKEITIDEAPKRDTGYRKHFVPKRNETEFPDTPVDVEECDQAIYAM